LRYLAEVACSGSSAALRTPRARRKHKRHVSATALQDILGELHDAVVSEQWLRDAASRRPARAKAEALVSTGVAGRPADRGCQGTPSVPKRLAWTAAWERLDRKKLLSWTGA